MNTSEPIPLDTRLLAARDRLKRQIRNRTSRVLAPILGNRLVFPCLIEWSAGRPARHEAFCLHPRWAQAYFGTRLIVSIPPAAITHYMADWICWGNRRVHASDYFLADGNLDQVLKKISALPIMHETRELLDANWNFRATRSYEAMCKRIKNGRPMIRQQILLDSEAAVIAYFMRFKELHDSILEHGLLPNSAVANRLGALPDREIGVAINSDGGLVKLPGGQHRLALALCLKVETVPVEIRMLHLNSLKLRGLKIALSLPETIQELASYISRDCRQQTN